MDIIKLLLDNKQDINRKNSKGCTLLAQACFLNDTELVNLLL